jgi:hypothetical protein
MFHKLSTQINLKNKKYIENAFFLIISLFVFTPTFKVLEIQLKYAIFLLIFPILINIIKLFKSKNYFQSKHLILIAIILIAHTVVTIKIDQETIIFYDIASIIFFYFVYLVCYLFLEKIIKNIKKIIFIFYILLLFSVSISLLNYEQDTWFFCGGVPNIFGIDALRLYDFSLHTEHEFAQDVTRISQFRLSFKELLFLENSHIGMIAPSIILYFLFKYENLDKYFKILSYFFILFVLIKSSTTLLIGIIINFTICIFFFKKYFSKFSTLIMFSLLVYSLLTIALSKECYSRLGIEDKIFIIKNLLIEKNKEDNINNNVKSKEDRNFTSLTTEVFVNSFKVMINGIKTKPLGWGLNRYEKAFEDYINQHEIKKEIVDLNRKDASNNFTKILVEFGLLGIIFYLILFLFITSKKIETELKIFIFPIIITQSIRGAGYFNGGFLLFALLFLILTFKKTRT